MKAKVKGVDLGSGSVGRLVARLALPAVAAQVINLLYNLVDRMYVGGIEGVGMDALAGPGVVFPITLIVSVTESAIQIVFNNNLTYWSQGNSDYTAALTAMLSANQMVCLPLNGLGTGVQPLVSYNYGSGDTARIVKTVKIVTVVALCGSTSVWLLSLLAPQVYGYIFSATPAVMELICRYTPFFMMGTVMFFAQMTLQNVFVALNQAGLSIFLACLRKVILLIPLCFILPHFFGAPGVFYSEGIADIVAGVITATTFFVMLPRILKKRRAYLELHAKADAASHI